MSQAAPDLVGNDYRVAMMLQHLRAAAAGEEIGRNIGEALYRVEGFADGRLSSNDADELCFAAVNAANRACADLPEWASRSHVRFGFRAFLAWIELKRENAGVFVRPVENAEIKPWLRVLRNIGHNASLIDEMAERAEANAARQTAGRLG